MKNAKCIQSQRHLFVQTSEVDMVGWSDAVICYICSGCDGRMGSIMFGCMRFAPQTKGATAPDRCSKRMKGIIGRYKSHLPCSNKHLSSGRRARHKYILYYCDERVSSARAYLTPSGECVAVHTNFPKFNSAWWKDIRFVYAGDIVIHQPGGRSHRSGTTIQWYERRKGKKHFYVDGMVNESNSSTK